MARQINPNPPLQDQACTDSWDALLQFSSQLVAALAATDNRGAPPHPWIERDLAIGSSLKPPLPPPETAKQIADVLSILAGSLRGMITKPAHI